MKSGDLRIINLKSIQIDDFYDKLPKWVEFVDAHHEYLSVNQQDHLPIRPLLTLILAAIKRGHCRAGPGYSGTNSFNMVLKVKLGIEINS
jgi:hypothetical protein